MELQLSYGSFHGAARCKVIGVAFHLPRRRFDLLVTLPPLRDAYLMGGDEQGAVS